MAARAVMEILQNARKNNVIVSVTKLCSPQETKAFLKPEWARVTLRGLPIQTEKTQNHRIAFILLKATGPKSVISQKVIDEIEALRTQKLGVQFTHFPWTVARVRKRDHLLSIFSEGHVEPRVNEHALFVFGPLNKLQRLINAAEPFKKLPAQPQKQGWFNWLKKK